MTPVPGGCWAFLVPSSVFATAGAEGGSACTFSLMVFAFVSCLVVAATPRSLWADASALRALCRLLSLTKLLPRVNSLVRYAISSSSSLAVFPVSAVSRASTVSVVILVVLCAVNEFSSYVLGLLPATPCGTLCPFASFPSSRGSSCSRGSPEYICSAFRRVLESIRSLILLKKR